MKVIALTYDYDLTKLSEIGRTWAGDVYKNKEFIFDYSAASYATFIDKNPTKILDLYTDDTSLMREKMNQYNIDQSRINYVDYTQPLSLHKNMKYSFDVLADFIHDCRSSSEFTLKIDNDLVFHSEIPEPECNCSDVYVWKYERLVYQGDPLMGEIKVAEKTLGNTNFKIYNLGIFGLPVEYRATEARGLVNEMTSVDISDVTDLDTKIWHCCEQTANNWIFHKYGFNVVEMYKYVNHLYDNKGGCIEAAKHLKK